MTGSFLSRAVFHVRFYNEYPKQYYLQLRTDPANLAFKSRLNPKPLNNEVSGAIYQEVSEALCVTHPKDRDVLN